MILTTVTLVGIALAAWFDYKVRRIPNWLTFSLIVFGFAYNGYESSLTGLRLSLFGLFLGILFLYFPFTCGGVGAGDVKLLGALGSLWGPIQVFQIFLASAVFGGIFSLMAMVKAKAVRNTCHGVFNRALCLMTSRKALSEGVLTGQKIIGIPYAWVIACGTLFVLLVLKGG